MRVSFPSTPASPNDYALFSGRVGAVSASKTYILRLSTLGTTEFGQLRVRLRQVNFGTVLSGLQYRPFGTTRVNHEFVITAPTTDSAAAWLVEVLQSSGTTYLDDISFYEANVTASNPDEHLRFEVNKTSSNRVVPLAQPWVDSKGALQCGALTLAPYSSIVLFKTQRACASVDAGTFSDAGIVVDAGFPTVDAGDPDAGTSSDAGLVDAGEMMPTDAGEGAAAVDGGQGFPVVGGCSCASLDGSALLMAAITLTCLRRRREQGTGVRRSAQPMPHSRQRRMVRHS